MLHLSVRVSPSRVTAHGFTSPFKKSSSFHLSNSQLSSVSIDRLKSFLKVTAETSDCAKSKGKHLNNLLG